MSEPARLRLAPEVEEIQMGMLDKIKGLVSGNADKAKEGVDKATEVAKSKTPDQVDGHVDQAGDKAKDVIDGL